MMTTIHRTVFFLLLLSVAVAAPVFAQEESEHMEIRISDAPELPEIGQFGATFNPQGQTLRTLLEAVNDTTLHNTTITLHGTILDVCRKKGCWMILTDGTTQMRITFKDYGFFVPTDCSGKVAMVQGVVSIEEIPEDLAKHYAEESETEDPEAITGPQRVVTMVADGVQIMN